MNEEPGQQFACAPSYVNQGVDPFEADPPIRKSTQRIDLMLADRRQSKKVQIPSRICSH